MKTKFRKITVNEKQYAWMVDFNHVTIWYDKKIIYCKDGYNDKSVTPKDIRIIIESL